MHDSRKVFLIENEPRCILAKYDDRKDEREVEFKTFDDSINVDDYIVIPSTIRHNMTICKVSEVDVEPDMSSHEKMDWIIGRVDKTIYDNTMEEEKGFISEARASERARLKAQLKEDFAIKDTNAFKAIASS